MNKTAEQTESVLYQEILNQEVMKRNQINQPKHKSRANRTRKKKSQFV